MLNPILVTALSQGVGLLAILAIGYGAIERSPLSDRWRAFSLGLWFGLGAVLAMSAPAKMSDGFILDVRCIVIGLAAAFGAPLTIVISTAIAIAYRLYLGGVGAVPGSLAIFLAAFLGFFGIILLRRMVANTLLRYALLGLVISTNLVTAFMFPFDRAIEVMELMYPLIGFTSVVAGGLLGTFMDRERRLMMREQHWRDAALTDALTQLPNRRWFEHIAKNALAACTNNLPCSLLVIDIDHFKRINDTYGHPLGDSILIKVADKIRRGLRQTDYAARIGGEEFAVLLTGTDARGCSIVAERIRSDIQAATDWGLPEGGQICVSIGCTSLNHACDYQTAFQTSDRALYSSKSQGRNRVTHAAISEIIPCENALDENWVPAN